MKMIKIILEKFEKLLRIFFIASIVFTLTGFLSRYGLLFDRAAHFRMQYFFLQLVFVFLYIILKYRKALFIAALVTAINLTQILPLYIKPSPVNFSELKGLNRISILSINLRKDNKKYRKTAEYIKSINPDFLLLTEVNQEWYKALSDILKQYTCNKFLLREDCFGIGLFSKLESNRMIVKDYVGINLPTIVAEFNIKEEPLTLILVHTLPPANKYYYSLRNKHLANISFQRNHLSKNLVIMGDLNTTSWSFSFKNLLKKMDLKDSRKGFGLQNSWPTPFPLLQIAIDHCLVSKNIIVLEHKIGPNIGSDHYPVYVQLGLIK